MAVKELGHKPVKMTKKEAISQLTGSQVDCSYCNSVYLIEPKDIKLKWVPIAYQAVTNVLYVKCHLCKRDLIIDATPQQRNAFLRWWHKLPFGGF